MSSARLSVSPEAVDRKPRLPLVTVETTALSDDFAAHTGYQRLLLFGKEFDLTILKPADRELSPRLTEGAGVVEFAGWRYLPSRLNVGIFYFWAFLVLARYRRRCAAICTTTGWPALVGIAAALFYRMRWIYSVWDDPFLDAHYNRQLGRYGRATLYWLRAWITARFHSCCHVLILNMHAQAIGRLSIRPTRIIHATNGHAAAHRAKQAHTRNPTEPARILYVGVVSSPRGCDLLVRAAQWLRDQGHPVTLHLIGRVEPSFRETLRRTHGTFDGWCHITGEVTHEECLRFIRTADVCVFPFPDTMELTYIYPIKILEYMAAGRAIVASRLVGVSELLRDRHDVLFFEPGSVADLSRKLLSVITDEQLQAHLGTNAKRTARRYCWVDVNNRITDKLAAILDRSKAACRIP